MKPYILLIILWSISISCIAQVSTSLEIPSTCAPSELLEVKVSVNKGDVSSVGKLELQIPDGLQFAKEKINSGATVKHKGGLLKFLWETLPTNPQFQVTFTLKAGDVESSINTLTGTFSYRKDDKTVIEQLPAANIEIVVPGKREESITIEPTATSATIKTETALEQKSENKVTKAAKVEASKKRPAQTAKPTKDDMPTALFHVQIMSSGSLLSSENLKKRYNTEREIVAIEFDGGYKYAIGGLKTYNSAKSLCNDVKASGEFPSCFVISSFKGKHIPLNEAIEMTR